MITFPSLQLFTAIESPAAAAGGEQPPLDALFAELLATASDALDLAAARDAPTGGKALPRPGPDLPPVELASAELPVPGSELLLSQAPPAENASAPVSSLEADAAVAPVPLPLGIVPQQTAAPGAGTAVPTAQSSPASLSPASISTLLAQGEAQTATQTVAPTAMAAAESPLQPQAPQSQPRSPLPVPLQHAPQDPAFPGELANRLQVFARNGMHEATLQLHPAELGRLQVSISTEGDQARVMFVADNAAAREAIEQSLPRLRELLAQSGLQLAHSDVSDQSLAGGQRDDSAGGTAGAHDSDSGPANSGADAPTLSDSVVGTHLVDYYI